MTLCCPNHQARGIPDRESAFSIAKSSCCEVTIFYTMRAPSLGAIAAHPRFPLRRGTFFRSPSPPYAHPNSQTLNQRKKTVHFLDKCVHFRKKLHSFFLPSRHHSFPLPPSLARVGALARTRTQRVFVFCLHRTAIRAQPTENKWIAREAFTLFHARHFEHNSLYHNLLR